MRDTKVAVKICKEYDTDIVGTALKDGFDLLGGLNHFIKPSHTVLIKPDIYNCTEPNVAKTTNPNIITALAELIAKIGAKCIIADSPKGDFNSSTLDNAYVKTQMLQSSNNGHATLNTNDKFSVITNPNGEYCRDIYVIDAINDADVIINVGKFRCDKSLGVIGCSQNLFGLIPGKFKQLVKSRCYTLKSYYNYLIDLYEALENKIVLNILDGVVGCEANNDPRILNNILIGENPYSVDATALKIINQSPEDSLLLNESVRRNKFNFKFQTLGDDIEPLVCSDFHYTTFLENIKSGSKSSFKREYNRNQKRPIINSKLCKGCKVCVSTCPMKAIEMQNAELGEHAAINYDKCISCFACLHNCPYKIIKTKTPIKYNAINRAIKKSLHSKQD
ncbi:MAG: DUF362 domain-containing protein [Clostridia bacterium]|nr:DUF362 domain-containing protein [Clostridia bacterium]